MTHHGNQPGARGIASAPSKTPAHRPATKTKSTAQAIKHLKQLLHTRLDELKVQLAAIGEDVSAAASDREIKAMNMLVRTLEKVLELERKHNIGKKRTLRIVDNARRMELAARIEALADTWEDPETRQPAEE